MMEVDTKLTKSITCRYYYMQIQLEFSDKQKSVISAQIFRSIIFQSVEQIFGECGASIPIDLLRYNQNSMEAVIRIPKINLTKIWSALTLCGNYSGRDCAFRVKRVSPFLVSFAANSRSFVHE